MSSYFNFTIERQDEHNNWICVGKSFYDDNLDIISPYILKHVFYDEERNGIKLEDLSKESFNMFTYKIDKYSNEHPYNFPYKVDDTEIKDIKDIESIMETEDRNNDLCLWFDYDYLVNNEKLIKMFTVCEESYTDTKDLMEKTKNIVITVPGGLTGIVFNMSPFSLIELMKYNNTLKEAVPYIKGYSVVDYYKDHKLVKQYYYDYNVSYYKDIVRICGENELKITWYKKNNDANNIAKGIVADILEEYPEDKNTKLYKRLKKYSKGASDYDSEYINELLQNRHELELLKDFMGENGRLIWNIIY